MVEPQSGECRFQGQGLGIGGGQITNSTLCAEVVQAKLASSPRGYYVDRYVFDSDCLRSPAVCLPQPVEQIDAVHVAHVLNSPPNPLGSSRLRLGAARYGLRVGSCLSFQKCGLSQHFAESFRHA